MESYVVFHVELISTVGTLFLGLLACDIHKLIMTMTLYGPNDNVPGTFFSSNSTQVQYSNRCAWCFGLFLLGSQNAFVAALIF